MNIAALRVIAFVFVAGAAGFVYSTSARLPDPVAANFQDHGHASSFNARDDYRSLMTALAALVPVLVYAGTAWMPRVFPRLLPASNSEFWFAAERRAATLQTVERFGLANAAIVAVFVAAMHATIARANIASPPYFEPRWGWMLLGGWLFFIALAVSRYHRHFRVDAPAEK